MKKHEEQSLYARLFIFMEPDPRPDPPLVEVPTPAAELRLELVPVSLSHGCAADCPSRNN